MTPYLSTRRLSRVLPLLLVIAAGVGVRSARAEGADPEPWPRSPNELLGRGVPTLVVGTLGDAASDARVATQAELLRGILFPTADVVDDASVRLVRGREAWPRNPLLFGGSHVNAIVRSLSAVLPFRVGAGRIEVGGRVFEGAEHRLIALVPPREADDRGPAHPPFLLYAGAGSPGVTEINAVPHGRHGILVADRFGPVLLGRWGPSADPAGVEWDTAPRTGEWSSSKDGTTHHLRRSRDGAAPTAPLTPAETLAMEARTGACAAGLTRARERLGIGKAEVPRVDFYVYPDEAAKRQWTWRGGDGHADLASRTVHVRVARIGALTSLAAHESTHVLCEAWGPVATSLVGEGLAVWVADAYGGLPLADWRGRIRGVVPPAKDLLGPAFRTLPETTSYPLAGFLVDTLITAAGMDGIRLHFFGATRATWEEACRRAGTTAEKVERDWRTRWE